MRKIDKFKYPKYGPGMMWEAAQKKLEEKEHTIIFNSKVTNIESNKNQVETGAP